VRTLVLILSVDEAERLEASLPAAVAQPDADVVVIDDACTDATRAVAERYGARLVSLAERVSYADAVNGGLAQALRDDHEAVVLLNADCILDEGFLAAATARLADPGVGVVAPLLLRATGLRPQDRLDIVDAAGMTIDRRRKNSIVGHGDPPSAHAQPGEVYGGDGACVLYRRAALEPLRPEVLDADMELWATDADLAWRVHDAGWRCAFEPAARGWHVRFYSPTTRDALPAEHRRLQFRNRLLMVLKNERLKGWRDWPHIALYEVLALGYALAREPSLLRGYVEAARLAPAVWSKRSSASARRPVKKASSIEP
jgi:GT2 family glycosyltransferase